MTPEHRLPADHRHLSVADQLKRLHGTDLDPGIDLEHAAAAPTNQVTEGARHSLSARVVTRLGARGATASRYALQGEIARGGMGAILEVYDEDLRRKLAMKVMLDEADGSSSGPPTKVDPAKLARFLEEAQVTGQLDHPGIVPVHELGVDPSGQVYFTMRRVRGRDLASIYQLVPSASEGWTTTRVTGILLKVCEAMAYAHSKGVVHRDLKPANVMVGQFGEVYVMDWGLARVRNHADRHDLRLRRDDDSRASMVETDRRDASTAPDLEGLYTMDGDIMGTPSYMSPEQARGKLDEIGEASDVYSVGAMLYRLLAGVAPYSAGESPVPPWVIIDRLLSGPPAPIEELAPDAPAELNAICAKAMARDPKHRYPNMLALAEDLRAFLEGRVVGAFETGALAEARKWVRRNKALASSLAAVVLALAVGLGTSIWLWRRADTSATLAEQRRVAAAESAESARRQASISNEVNSFLNNDLLAAVAPDMQGVNVTVRDVLDQASLHLAGRFDGEPEIEAALRMTIGVSYSKLGLYERAREHLERALELRRTHLGVRAEPTLKTMIDVAFVWGQLGRFDDAIALYRETIESTREVLGPEHESTLTAMSDLGIALGDAGRMDESRASYEQVLAIEERVLGTDHDTTLATANNLALLDQRQGRLDQAVERFRRVLERRRAIHGDRHPDALVTAGNLSVALGDVGRFDEAEALSRETLALVIEVYGPDHPLSSRMHGNLGTLLYQRGRIAEAEPLFVEALRVARLRYGDEHPRTLALRGQVAGVQLELGRAQETLEECTAVLDVQRRVLGARHPETLQSMNRLAGNYRSLDRLNEAEALYREVIASYREVFGPDHPSAIISIENLAGVLLAKGDYGSSEAMVREVLDARRRVLGPAHPDVAKTTYNLGMVLKSKGDRRGALESFDEALKLFRAIGAEPHPMIPSCLKLIGDLHAAAGDHDQAITAYREGLDALGDLQPDDALAGSLLHQIGVAELASQSYEDALAAFQEALPLREGQLGRDGDGTRSTLLSVAQTLVKLGRFEDAEPVALDYHERSVRAVGASHEQTVNGRKLLARIYAALGRTDEAAKWK